jgi:DNA primase
MDLIERLKRLNLANFLERVYAMTFVREGEAYVSLSPFRKETRGSFYVREERDGHWVFKDHSSGFAGSIFDFVLTREDLRSFGETLRRVCELTGFAGDLAVADGDALCAFPVGLAEEDNRWKKNPGADGEVRYDIEKLYAAFRKTDASACRDYLLGRGINGSLVTELLDSGTVVMNRLEKGMFCCFAVRGVNGELCGLYNRQIDGDEKFVLGKKAPFTLDWEALGCAESVFLCEGVIDYLSMKTLEGRQFLGLALLGNQLNVDASIFPACRRLISAFDGDSGGFSALSDVREAFDQCEVEVYDLENCTDPNDFLQAKRASALTAEKKLQLYHEFTGATNKAEVARKWGLNRSYVYDVVKECKATLLELFASRRRGRPRTDEAPDLAEARRRLLELEEKYEQEARERERLYCRSEFLELRLKWAEIEAAERRGEVVDSESGPAKKRHAKKKRKMRR